MAEEKPVPPLQINAQGRANPLVEHNVTAPERIPLYRQVWDPIGLTPAVTNWPYAGSGTEEDPYVVTWIADDPRNPMGWSPAARWGIMMVVAMCALMVSLDMRLSTAWVCRLGDGRED